MVDTNVDRKTDGWISDVVGALTDPIICHPQWLESPPEKIREQITLERLIENMVAIKENRPPLGTDAECAWYLSSTSMTRPLPSEWVRIYMYVFNRMCKSMKTEIPDDLKQDELSQYEQGLLLHLKQWIYRARSEHRKGQDRERRKEEREQKKQEKRELTPKMFEF